MKKLFVSIAVVVIASTASVAAFGRETMRNGGTEKVTKFRDLSFEFIGQFQSSSPDATPPTHIHYGYLSYIRGVAAFKASPPDETTALYTFYAVAATPHVITDGPLRIVTRIGTLTIYRDPSTNGSFANPDTFRDGSPVLVASFRQQVVVNTVASSNTVFHQNTITSTRAFDSGKGEVQLGEVGERFTTHFSGVPNMPGPPSGFIAGYAISD
jgi:hypothetical protein